MSEALTEKIRSNHDEYARERDNIVTLGAEVLDGEMHNPGMRYRVEGDDLISERCSGSAREFFDNGIKDAEEAARKDPRKAFELPRRIEERAELDDKISMHKPGGFNTMVAVSDFPEQVEKLGGDFLGYNLARKQAMVRIVTRKQDGSLLVQTQSLDGSHRGALEQIYSYFGKVPQPGELLGQRICVNLDPAGQDLLRPNLKRAYDHWLEKTKGGKWSAGRQDASPDKINTYDFAAQQTDLIDVYMKSPRAKDDVIRYLVTLRGRYENRSSQPSVGQDYVYRSALPLAMEFEMHMRRAISQNWQLTGCGMTINLGNELESELAASGYGDADKILYGPDKDKKGKLTFHCSKGHLNRRPRNDTIPNCTTCGIRVRC